MLPKALRVLILLVYTCNTMVGAAPATVTAQSVQAKTSSPPSGGASLEGPHVRIKDLAHFSSVRENPLVGYGLVVGLNNTGDTMSRSTFTRESLTGMLERLGVNIRDGVVPSGKNVAAVMVTASLPAFSQPGTKLDITVSALGDAKELRGGTLLVTPLLGADGNVYAVGQGAVLAAGIQVSGKAAKEVKGVPTCARIVNGAIVERAMGFELASLKELNLTLHNPDFTTARRVADAINEACGDIAMASDSSNIRIKVPSDRANGLVAFMTEIEQIMVQPDAAARVIIDANNDVVTLTSMAKIMPVALTHGSITIKVVETPQVYMPQPNPVIVGASGPVAQNLNAAQGGGGGVTQQAAVLADLAAGLTEAQTTERKTLFDAQQAELAKLTDPAQINKLKSQQQVQMANLIQNQNNSLSQLVASAGNNGARGGGNQQSSSNQSPNGQVSPVVVDKTDVQFKEATGKFAVIQSGADLQEFVNALNALGATPKDMMAILQNIKAAGALQADIVLT